MYIYEFLHSSADEYMQMGRNREQQTSLSH